MHEIDEEDYKGFEEFALKLHQTLKGDPQYQLFVIDERPFNIRLKAKKNWTS
jgi:hypothetical protein